MKKYPAVSVFLFLLFLTPVFAQDKTVWTKIWESKEGDNPSVWYVNLKTIKKNGDRVFYWRLMDFDKPQNDEVGIPYLSTTVFFENDCLKTGQSGLQVFYFEENMGKGEVVKVRNFDREFYFFPPESNGAKEIREICVFAETAK